jgi:hypothetical protein
MSIQTFANAEDALAGRDARKIANNTRAVRLDADTVGIVLHQTAIVKYRRNGEIVLNSGGWKTVTTKARMNEFSPVSVRQSAGEWFANGIEFEDGMVIAPDGRA